MNLLVAEDFNDCATTTAAILRSQGHSVRIVRDGPAVIDACRDELPDTVLLDIGLPGLDGYKVAERLREEFGPSTPQLIALTGFGQASDHRKSQAAGIDMHLVKPVDFNKLNALLRPVRVG